MALLFMDSFDHYAIDDVTEKWTTRDGSTSYSSIGTGRNSTSGVQLGGSSRGALFATVLGGVDTVIIAAAWKPSGLIASGTIMAVGSASAWECGLAVNADGTLQPATSNTGVGVPGSLTNWTLIGTPSTYALQSNVWHYIEFKVTVHGSTGAVQVRVNGIEVLNLTGLDTLAVSTTLTRIAIGGTSGCNGVFDDLVVMDTTGSVNNSFLGDVTVTALYPNGAGTTSGWTPSAGSNYQNVDEASPNDDTDYNATAVVSTKDLYAFADASAGADIRAVQVLASVRKAAEGPGQVKLVTRSSSTDYDGVAQGIGGTSYSYVREVYETDPATAAAWSESGFNAAEFGIKKTA